MIDRIKEAFENGKAFIPFITSGDPSLETTEQLVYAMDDAGADIIELGVPFSDPTAEGPVIQAANLRALSAGTTTDKIFSMIAKIRQKTQIPLILMTYANVVYSYDTELFLKKAASVGVDGLILADVPYEEKEEFSDVCDEYGLCLISMVAPTSKERIKMIAKDAKGFVYCVSSLGVTGTRKETKLMFQAWSNLSRKQMIFRVPSVLESACLKLPTKWLCKAMARLLARQSLKFVKSMVLSQFRMLQNMLSK